MAVSRVFQKATLPQKWSVARHIRWNSTQPPVGERVVSPHVGFYKTFTRPIAKVLLMATFTYQLAYWGWVKLEKDEVKREKSAEIEILERKLAKLTKKREAEGSP